MLILLIVGISFAMSTLMMSFSLVQRYQPNIDNEPVGKIWIEAYKPEKEGSITWYRLKAFNSSGECFYLSGNVKIVSTGKIIEVGKNIPASANCKENAVILIELPQKFVRIIDSFVANDCKPGNDPTLTKKVNNAIDE